MDESWVRGGFYAVLWGLTHLAQRSVNRCVAGWWDLLTHRAVRPARAARRPVCSRRLTVGSLSLEAALCYPQ